MGNPDTDHERFGELSALAIIGQVSPEEYRELKAHLESCGTCRQEHDALARILLTELPLAHEEKDSDLESLIAERPAERSLRGHGSTGFASFDPSARNTRWASDSLVKLQRLRVPAVQAYAAIFLLFLTVGALGIRVVRESQLDKLRSSRIVTLNEEIVGLRNQIHDLDKGAQNSYSAGRSIPAMTKDRDTRGSELDYGRFLARSREVESQLRTATEEIAILKQEASSGADRETQLSARLSETQGTLNKLSAELKTVRESYAQDASVIARQESQLLETEEKLAAATNAMDRDRKLLVADRDIRDLMGARNLRIIDVFDVDGKGKTRKPFGRVFFTEGKSLIFYAFDLGNDRPGLQSAAYQAWGSEGSFEHGVRSLGIFYRDDQKANRWVLKFDDPDVLAEIDSVFVTTEPTGGSKKPTGGRLLAAYVKASLNHP